MVDKKKVTIFVAVAIVIIAALFGGFIWGLNSKSEPSVAENNTTVSTESTATSNEVAASATPDSTGTPSGDFDGVLSFDEDQENLAINAAIAAAEYSSPESDQARQNSYNNAGFSPELTKSFSSVWVDIYDPEKVTSLTVEATFERVWLSDVTGDDKDHTYRAGVLLTYDADWMKRSGGASGQPKAQGTWWVTIDEKTGKVTEVDQPTKSELNVDLAK